nr:hypothetical protein [Tanacetum cinerariifolium]
ISYDKAYKDMQQKIERLQAQLGVLKGKSKGTSCVSNTLNPLSQRLKNENVELEFQVLNYARENALLKATYKNLFDSISVSPEETLLKLDEIHAFSKPVTSNSASTPQESKGVNNDKVIAPGMFRISPDKVSREAKKVPNTNNEHMSSACNNFKLDSQDVISKVVCAVCYPDLFVVHRLRLFQAHDRKSKASH